MFGKARPIAAYGVAETLHAAGIDGTGLLVEARRLIDGAAAQ